MVGWDCSVFSKTHPGKVRPYNEDALLDLSERKLWVVADGMGGHQAGDIASNKLIERIEQCALNTPDLSIDDLRDAITQANAEIYQFAQSTLAGQTMGTTVVLLYIQDSFFHCLWVGDSRIYKLTDGRLQQKTRDHSQVMDLIDQGVIRACDAESHPLANVITRAIGVEAHVTIDQVSGELKHGDQFLLCSDGLSKELSDTEIKNCLSADTVNNSGLALLHSTLVRGARDNVTCVLVNVSAKNRRCHDVNLSDDVTVPVFVKRRTIDV